MHYYFISCERNSGVTGATIGTSFVVKEVEEHLTPLEVIKEFIKEKEAQFPGETVMITQFNKVDYPANTMDTKTNEALIQMCDLDLAVKVVISRADELTIEQGDRIAAAIWAVQQDVYESMYEEDIV